jgi:hypothetical protein
VTISAQVTASTYLTSLKRSWHPKVCLSEHGGPTLVVGEVKSIVGTIELVHETLTLSLPVTDERAYL